MPRTRSSSARLDGLLREQEGIQDISTCFKSFSINRHHGLLVGRSFEGDYTCATVGGCGCYERKSSTLSSGICCPSASFDTRGRYCTAWIQQNHHSPGTVLPLSTWKRKLPPTEVRSSPHPFSYVYCWNWGTTHIDFSVFLIFRLLLTVPFLFFPLFHFYTHHQFFSSCFFLFFFFFFCLQQGCGTRTATSTPYSRGDTVFPRCFESIRQKDRNVSFRKGKLMCGAIFLYWSELRVSSIGFHALVESILFVILASCLHSLCHPIYSHHAIMTPQRWQDMERKHPREAMAATSQANQILARRDLEAKQQAARILEDPDSPMTVSSSNEYEQAPLPPIGAPLQSPGDESVSTPLKHPVRSSWDNPQENAQVATAYDEQLAKQRKAILALDP